MAEITFNVYYIIVPWQFAQGFDMKSTQAKRYLHNARCDVCSHSVHQRGWSGARGYMRQAMWYWFSIFSVLRDSIEMSLFVKGLTGAIMSSPLLMASVPHRCDKNSCTGQTYIRFQAKLLGIWGPSGDYLEPGVHKPGLFSRYASVNSSEFLMFVCLCVCVFFYVLADILWL